MSLFSSAFDNAFGTNITGIDMAPQITAQLGQAAGSWGQPQTTDPGMSQPNAGGGAVYRQPMPWGTIALAVSVAYLLYTMSKRR